MFASLAQEFVGIREFSYLEKEESRETRRTYLLVLVLD